MPIDIGKIPEVARYWSRIDDQISQTLEEHRVKIEAQSALLNVYPSTHQLGCGEFGCVYPTRTERQRWVVKVSLDPFEGPLTNLILHNRELRLHPGVAFILGVWELPVTFAGKQTHHDGRVVLSDFPIYVILREDMEPIKSAEVPKGFLQALYSARRSAEELNKIADEVEQTKEVDKLDPYISSFIDEINQIDDHEVGGAVADFMDEYLKREGVALADIHGGNLGWRIHDTSGAGGFEHPESQKSDYCACLDIGASKIKPGKAPMAVIRNPGIARIR